MRCKDGTYTMSAEDLSQYDVAIYGAGIFGRQCRDILNSCRQGCVRCFIDNNDAKIGKMIGDTIVKSVNEVCSDKNANYVYVIAVFQGWYELYKDLLNKGIARDKICLYNRSEFTWAADGFEQYSNRQGINHFYHSKIWFDYHITEHCNLNCSGCFHYSSIAKEEFADIDVYKKNLLRMKDIFGDRVSGITILGGEPLLHPDVCSFVTCAREIFPQTGISVITNGILLNKMDESFFNCLNENNASVSLSKYPIKLDFDWIFNKFKEEGISYSYEERDDWGKLCIDIDGKSDYEKSFYSCIHANACITLTPQGRLFTCINAHLHQLSDYFNLNKNITDEDYVDIFKEDDPDVIMERLSRPVPMCKYCKIPHIVPSEWKNTSRELSEWT